MQNGVYATYVGLAHTYDVCHRHAPKSRWVFWESHPIHTDRAFGRHSYVRILHQSRVSQELREKNKNNFLSSLDCTQCREDFVVFNLFHCLHLPVQIRRIWLTIRKAATNSESMLILDNRTHVCVLAFRTWSTLLLLSRLLVTFSRWCVAFTSWMAKRRPSAWNRLRLWWMFSRKYNRRPTCKPCRVGHYSRCHPKFLSPFITQENLAKTDALERTQQQRSCNLVILQFSPEHERHIREHEYLADILSDWEEWVSLILFFYMHTSHPILCATFEYFCHFLKFHSWALCWNVKHYTTNFTAKKKFWKKAFWKNTAVFCSYRAVCGSSAVGLWYGFGFLFSFCHVSRNCAMRVKPEMYIKIFLSVTITSVNLRALQWQAWDKTVFRILFSCFCQ